VSWPPTQSYLLHMLVAGDQLQQSIALRELMIIYGPPLYTFARRRWPDLSKQDCQDLIGDFFVKCIDKRVFQRVDPDRRLRNLLAKSFTNFTLNRRRDANAAVRRPPNGLISMEEMIDRHGRRIEPRDNESPEDTYRRVLRISLFERSLIEFERRCADAGQVQKYQIYRRLEIDPVFDDTPPPTQADVAAEFGISSKHAVGRIVRSARDEFRALLLQGLDEDLEPLMEADLDLETIFDDGRQR
jgi:hypothetical protein